MASGQEDLSTIASVASFFISRTDTEVDRRLEEVGSEDALSLRGKTAVAQAQVATKSLWILSLGLGGML